MTRTLLFCRPLLATLLTALTVFSATAEETARFPESASTESVLPAGVTVDALRHIDQEVFRYREEARLLKARTAHQDALNELEESRLKLKRGEPVTSGIPAMMASEANDRVQAVRPPSVSAPRLAEVWNEKKTMRAAVFTGGRQITLSTGDLWPGTAFRIKGISVRGVALDNGTTIPMGGTL